MSVISRKVCAVLLTSILVSIPSAISTDASPTHMHVIPNVPYVSQLTEFYCNFACPTMILQFLRCNVSLYDVLFQSGGGYGICYSPASHKRMIYGSSVSSIWRVDRAFLGDLYGLTYHETWVREPDDTWERYWNQVKQNITDNRPVMTMVDPIHLTSVRNSLIKTLNVLEQVINNMPEAFWDVIPVFSSHAIVIVGYNESNNSMCYHDPITALLGHPECGYYAWMELTPLKESMEHLAKISENAYLIGTFYPGADSVGTIDESFGRAHARNKEKLRGNLSVYDPHLLSDLQCQSIGIQALQEASEVWEHGVKTRLVTFYLYKFYCMSYGFSLGYTLYTHLERLFPATFQVADYQEMINNFYQLAIEKEDMAIYLSLMKEKLQTPELIEVCEREGILLTRQSEHYRTLATIYATFFKKGIVLSPVAGCSLLEQMNQVLTEILLIEQQLAA